MKFLLLTLLIALLFVQSVSQNHDILGIGKSYRYLRGYSSPWGRWGKGVWGKSSFGNPVYGNMGMGGMGSMGGFGNYGRYWKHQAESSIEDQ